MLATIMCVAAFTITAYLLLLCAFDWLQRSLFPALRPLPRGSRAVVAVFEGPVPNIDHHQLEPLAATDYFWVSQQEARLFRADGCLPGLQLCLLLSKLAEGDAALVLFTGHVLVRNPGHLLAAVQKTSATIALSSSPTDCPVLFAVRHSPFALRFADAWASKGSFVSALLHLACESDDSSCHKIRAGFTRADARLLHVIVQIAQDRLVEPSSNPPSRARTFLAQLLHA